MAQSYNGWPASSDKNAIGIVTSDLFPGGVKDGDVKTVLKYVVEQIHHRVEGVVGGTCWGYTYKANVNNPSSLSCHASGTAVDFNAPQHPNGAVGTWTEAQRGEIYQILAEVEGSVHWLEAMDGEGTSDEMHFEICVDAHTLAGVASRLGTGPKPQPEPDPEPQGGPDMFIAIHEKGLFALCGSVLFTFRDLNSYGTAQANSPGVPVLAIGDWISNDDRSDLYNNLVAQHHAALR